MQSDVNSVESFAFILKRSGTKTLWKAQKSTFIVAILWEISSSLVKVSQTNKSAKKLTEVLSNKWAHKSIHI